MSVCYELEDDVITRFGLKKDRLDSRDFLESSLWEFAQYVNPTYAYGEIHHDVFDWLQSGDKPYQLLLLPRDHLKSHCIATWVAWQITREPWSTCVYLTAGEDLAKNQMYAIKNILYCDEYKLLWPEMIEEEKNKRDKDTQFALNVDHPERKRRRIRDNTIIIKTVKSNAIGLHCSHLVLDDVVVPQFAYSRNGRLEVQQAVAQFASIKSTDAITKAVGTRYHPEDLYNDFREARLPILNEDGDMVTEEALWDIMEYKLETRGDGTGEYLWPRTYSSQLKQWFGFNAHVRALKRAEYHSLGQEVQFLAQYYNEPNDPSLDRVQKDNFHYYDKAALSCVNGKWYVGHKYIEIYAGMDVAFTDLKASGGKRADYTAICVLGIDCDGFIYILALDRFKTDDYDEYYKRVIQLHEYWGFRKIRVETNTGGKLVKKALDKLIRKDKRLLIVEPRQTTVKDEAKHERHASTVEPLYKNNTVLHYIGGLVSILEDEVRLLNPPTDDLEDALFLAVEDATPPSKRSAKRPTLPQQQTVQPESRFGGRRSKRGNRCSRI